ncbi:MAG: response regulator [Chlamydiales bacterium]|nr:response regulator [Chlamydiales bacterium]
MAHLKNEGRNDQITLVQTPESFLQEISTGQYDALLLDYLIPGYDAILAIEIAEKAGIPTLIVSGVIGEEMAVEIIKKGAVDYISKTHLIKLSTAIDRAIEEARKTKENKELLDFLKRAEEESRFKSLFLAEMSHEIRTPLTTILGYCDFLYEEIQEKLEKDPSLKEWFTCLEKIRVSGEYILGMLSNLLKLSEIEMGKIILKPDYFSLRIFCDKIKEIWESSIQKKNQNLEYSIDPNLPDLIFTDQVRLQQVLMNLFSNAVKYTREGGGIRFTVKREDGSVLFIVGNEGEPLSEEELEHLFELFYRGENLARSQTPGLGLGLLISKLLCDRLGGRIEVNCENGWVNFLVRTPLKDETLR